MCGLIRASANRSRSFDTVDRFVIGLKFLKSETSRPGFLINRVTRPFFIDAGNLPVANDRLAKCAITLDNSALHCFRSDIGSVSSGDVLVGAALMSRSTSAAVTVAKLDRVADGTDGGRQGVIGDCINRRPASTAVLTRCTLSLKKLLKPFARTAVSMPSYQHLLAAGCRSRRTVRHSNLGEPAALSKSSRTKYERVSVMSLCADRHAALYAVRSDDERLREYLHSSRRL